MREVSRLVAQIGISGLKEERDPIINRSLQAGLGKLLAYVVALAGADGVDMIHVARVLDGLRSADLAARQQLVVNRRMAPARFGPRFQMPQLHAKDRSPQSLHAI